MEYKPRNPKESLFSRGGYWVTFGYGLLITITTVFAFLMIPIFEGHATSLEQIAEVLTNNDAIRMQSQTAAFCVLSLSELFHMLGMTSIKKSFVHNFWSKNWLLWLSFALGVGLQVAVVNIPGLNGFFSCAPLDIAHWGIVLALSVAPVIVHEIVALVLFIKRKVSR
jgi:Ca2+-transporting ATPase